ncbi:hypothetical protein H4582DRAFT_2060368 [Lactarius indigo]|nr:hypothetical protein H4582DRAFT_2060368 [Lactarius indigo]
MTTTATGNFHDLKDLQLTFIKFLHVVGGIYIKRCEFFTSIWFEWQATTRKRPYRWSIWLYSGCRFSALFAVFTTFIGFGVTTPIHCRAWLAFVLLLLGNLQFFTYSSIVFASALIVLRIVAVWQRNWFSEAIWSTQHGQATCLVTKIDRDMIAIATIGEDVVLITLLLLAERCAGQGILWFIIVAVADIPKTVSTFLNLNGAQLRNLLSCILESEYFDLIFQTSERNWCLTHLPQSR